MTLFFNVTDAVGMAPNHGITRTERQLAQALVGRADIAFVAVDGGRALRVDEGDVVAAIERAVPEATPIVERFGIDPPSRPPIQSMRTSLRRSMRAPAEERRPTQPAALRSEDVLVSVGLDWVHDVIDLARRHRYGAGGRYIGFCYDLIPIDHPEWLFPPDPDGFRRHLGAVVSTANRVVCISEHTRTDLLRHFPDVDPDAVAVLRLGADAAVAHEPRHDAFAASLFDGEPFAIYCATIDRRKNHQLLYRVVKEWARSGRPGNVAFVGRLGSGVDDLIDCLRHDPLVAGRVVHVTNCDDAHLGALYRRAAIAVYPSLYEGWGLGVTEALAHATPCVVASGSSLEEAGLGVCEVLHPLRTGQWADVVGDFLVDPPMLAPFDLPTWADAADELVRLATT
ncbi:MAG: glycosyltransferase family 1 protein [Ilumatobacteraceae bacterium]